MGRNLKLKHRESDFEFTKNHKRLLLGSVFLMATSAIGPEQYLHHNFWRVLHSQFYYQSLLILVHKLIYGAYWLSLV